MQQNRTIRLRHWLEYGGLRLAGALLRALPVEMSTRFMGLLWRALAPLIRTRQKRARHHLALAMPDIAPAERRRIIGRMWEHLGRTAAETLLLEHLLAQQERFEVTGLDMVESLLADGRGALFISLHSGNWELALWPVATAGLQPSVIYKPMENPLVDRWMQQKRALVHTGGLLEKNTATARRLVGLLRGGARIGLMGDRRAGKGHVMLPFFGRLAPTSIVPARLALKLDIPLVVGRVVRLPGTRFHIECVHVSIDPTGDFRQDSIDLTKEINRMLEGWIREYPDQWMWAHKRWGSETDRLADKS